jgi:hypothetical protein
MSAVHASRLVRDRLCLAFRPADTELFPIPGKRRSKAQQHGRFSDFVICRSYEKAKSEITGETFDQKSSLRPRAYDLDGKRTFFLRIISCQAGELKPGDKVKLAVFDVDPVPQEVGRDFVEIPRVFYAFEFVK